MTALMNHISLEEQLWLCLAKDVCPNCGKHDLIVENQQNSTAIIICPKCRSEYQMSPIRSRGVRKIS